MIVGVLTLELWVEQSQSLKSKRMVIKSLKDRLRRRFNVSVAEVGYLATWQRCTLAVVAVSGERQFVNQILDQARELVTRSIQVRVLDGTLEWR